MALAAAYLHYGDVPGPKVEIRWTGTGFERSVDEGAWQAIAGISALVVTGLDLDDEGTGTLVMVYIDDGIEYRLRSTDLGATWA